MKQRVPDMNSDQDPGSTEYWTKRGYRLFPCKRKIPLVKWPKESTDDPETISAWSIKYPNCSWAVDCGKSGLFVLDNDRGKNLEAIASLQKLEAEHGKLPETFRVRTQSGGYHDHFHGHGKNSAGNKLGPGLDTRGDGGYVIVIGDGYSVVNDVAIVDAPEYLIRLTGQQTERPEKSKTPITPLDTDFAIELFKERLKYTSPAIEGNGGNRRTFEEAAKGKDFGLSEGKTYELMLEIYNPRCEPPWPGDELATIVANAYQYGANPPGAANPQAVFTEFIDDTANPYKLLSRSDIMLRPPLKWIVKGVVPTRGSVQIYGQSAAGKTFYAMDLGIHIAEGTEWFGHRVNQAPVVYLMLEGEGAVKIRIEAWEKFNGRPIPEGFYVVAQPWSIINPKNVVNLAAKTPKDSVIFIDTQNRAAPTADENSSKDMGGILEGVKMLEQLVEGVVILITHSGKDISKGPRGHSSQIPAADAVIEVLRDGNERRWRTVKVKDGSDGEVHKFCLVVVPLGVDEDGDPISSCVISTDGIDTRRTVHKPRTESQNRALDSYHRAAEISGLFVDGVFIGVHVDEWRKEFYRISTAATREAKEVAFRRARNDLVGRGDLLVDNDVYLPSFQGYAPIDVHEPTADR